MIRQFTNAVQDNECIGDSLNKMNLNWQSLDFEAQRLNTVDTSLLSAITTTNQTLSVLNASDTATIDLTWTPSTRTLQGAVKSNSITSSNLALSSVTADALFSEQVNGTPTAPIYAARAWVSFNGTTGGSNAAQTILASGNIQSVTRVGTNNGEYLITFETALPHANYACVGGGYRAGVVGNNEASPNISFSNLTTNTVIMGCQDNDANSYNNGTYLTAVFFG